jgi:hypothetical protein
MMLAKNRIAASCIREIGNARIHASRRFTHRSEHQLVRDTVSLEIVATLTL